VYEASQGPRIKWGGETSEGVDFKINMIHQKKHVRGGYIGRKPEVTPDTTRELIRTLWMRITALEGRGTGGGPCEN